MSHEQYLFPQPAETKVEQTLAAVERPAPSVAEERLADDVFSRQQGNVATAMLGLHAGLAIMHHLALETFQRDEEEPKAPPRRKPTPRPAE